MTRGGEVLVSYIPTNFATPFPTPPPTFFFFTDITWYCLFWASRFMMILTVQLMFNPPFPAVLVRFCQVR